MRKGFFNLPLVLFAIFGFIVVIMFAPAFIQMTGSSTAIAPDAITKSYYTLIPAMMVLIGMVTLLGYMFIA